MNTFQTLIAIVSAIILFLYALRGFSREIREAGGTTLESALARATSSRWSSFLMGAVATAIVQSSSAVTALTVALVDAGVVTFGASLGVVLGANVGTTLTAWLVSFKLTAIGPVFIVLGAVLSALPVRTKVVGQAVFYFGLIFFALELVSTQLQPLKDEPLFLQWLQRAENPWLGVLAGIVATLLVQSSSVTVGLAILLVQQGLLPAEAAIPMVIGANVGTTSTGLIASVSMKPVAKATAVANFAFNTAGVLVFLPFLVPFSRYMVQRFGSAEFAVAWAHLIFNLIVVMPFLLFLPLVERQLRERFLKSS